MEVVGQGCNPERGVQYVHVNNLLKQLVHEGTVSRDWQAASAALADDKRRCLYALLPSCLAPAGYAHDGDADGADEARLRRELLERLRRDAPRHTLALPAGRPVPAGLEHALVAGDRQSTEPSGAGWPPSYWACCRLYDDYCQLQPGTVLRRTLLGRWADRRTHAWKQLLARWTAGNVHWAEAVARLRTLADTVVPDLRDRLVAARALAAQRRRKADQLRDFAADRLHALAKRCAALGVAVAVDNAANDGDLLAGVDVEATVLRSAGEQLPRVCAVIVAQLRDARFAAALSAYVAFCAVLCSHNDNNVCPILRQLATCSDADAGGLLLDRRSDALTELAELEQFYAQRQRELAELDNATLPGDAAGPLNSKTAAADCCAAVAAATAALTSPQAVHCFEVVSLAAAARLAASIQAEAQLIRRERLKAARIEQEQADLQADAANLQDRIADHIQLLRTIVADLCSDLSKRHFEGSTVVLTGIRLLDELQQA